MTSIDDEIENLLGDAPAKPKTRRPHNPAKKPGTRRMEGPPRRALPKREKPPAPKAAPAPSKKKPETDGPDLSQIGVRGGVTTAWLAQVFGFTPEHVRRRLASCPVLSQTGRGFRYDLKEAAAYLVDPKIDIEDYLKDLRSTDLPASLQKEVWDARLKRQKWEIAAGDLWHTEKVMTVLSDMFTTIKSTLQLWPDTVERQKGLTEAQRTLLVGLCDALQDEIYQGLLEATKRGETKASISDLDPPEGMDEDDLEVPL